MSRSFSVHIYQFLAEIVFIHFQDTYSKIFHVDNYPQHNNTSFLLNSPKKSSTAATGLLHDFQTTLIKKF